VEFSLMVEKKTNKKSAVKIKMGSPTGTREQGIVSTMKDSFGFIECADRPARIFFHFSEMMDRDMPVRVSDEVEFSVTPSDRSGQENATKICILPKGTVVFEIEQEGKLRGVVHREPRQIRSNQRSQRDRGPPPPQEQFGQILVPRETTVEVQVVDSEDASPTEDAAPTEDTAQIKSAPKPKFGKKPDGDLYDFSASEVGETGSIPLIPGDEVEFSLLMDKRTKKKRAIRIALTKLNPARERGVVCAIREPFGYMKCESRDQLISFHLHTVSNPKHEVQVNDEMEFTVISANGNHSAVRVDILPAGTVVLFDSTEAGRRQGVIKQQLSEKSLGKYSRCCGGIIEVSKADDDAPTEKVQFDGEDMEDCRFDPRMLNLGDVMEFETVVEKRTGTQWAKCIQLVEMNPACREEGIVSVLKDNFGFIRCAERDATIFFHFSQHSNSDQALRIGDEVSFDASVGDNGKENATRISSLPKGTVVFEDVLDGRWEGVIARECRRGRESTNGIIACSLHIELPGDEKPDASTPLQADAESAAQSEHAPAPPEGVTAEADDAAAAEAAAGEEAAGEEAAANQLGDRQMGTKLAYRSEDVQLRAVLRAGDAVEFVAAIDRRTKQLFAKCISSKPKAGVVRQHRGRMGVIAEGAEEHKVNYFTEDVEGGIELNSGDEVEFIVVFDMKTKSNTARQIRRTKAAPDPGERPASKIFRGERKKDSLVTAKGPDGTRGFAAGRGRPIPASPATSVLDCESSLPPTLGDSPVLTSSESLAQFADADLDEEATNN